MNDSLENSLIQTIKNSDLKELSIDIGEVGFDHLIGSDIIKDIPVLGGIVKLIKTGISIRDHFFVKKLLIFIKEFDHIDIKEREKLIDKMYKDYDYNEKVGENIIMIIDKIDETQKVYYISKAFISYLNGLISVIQLQRIINGINQTLIVNLNEIKKYYQGDNYKLSPDIIHNLANNGFVNLGSVYGGTIMPQRNELGKLLYEQILVKI